MYFNIISIVAVLFIAIPGIIVYSFRSKTKAIMKKVNPGFTGHVNNSLDFFRIIKAYRNSQEVNKKEKIHLRLTIVLVSISWVAGLIYFTSIIFFSHQILN